MSEAAVPDEPWGEPQPGRAIEQYGPGEADIIIWDTASNYSRIRAMRLEGKTIPEISAALNLSVSTVKQAITNAIKAESAAIDGEEIQTILGLEMERLDHMLQSHWWAAKAGDIDSTKAVLAVSKERREWLKWAEPKPEANLGITNNILVVGGTEAEFLKSLSEQQVRLEAEHGTIEVEVEEEASGDGSEHSD